MMKYFEVLIQTQTDGACAKACIEHDSLDAAKQACYAELSAGMASTALASVTTLVVDEEGCVEMMAKERGRGLV